MLAFMKTLASVILKLFRKPHHNFRSGFPSLSLVDFIKRMYKIVHMIEAAFEEQVIGGFLYAATISLWIPN